MMLATAAGEPWIEDVLRVVLLRDYNTRLVVPGTALLGATSGVIGSFLLLRKRALLGDTLSHAMLPGVAVAFLVMVGVGGDGKWLPGLLLGALVAGLIGVGFVMGIRRFTRLRDDAALGIVLSVMFGAGVFLLTIVQKMPGASAAGLESFIYGKTASMTSDDLRFIVGAAAVVLVATILMHKELGLLCFNEDFARTIGWSTALLDGLLMLLVTLVAVIGLQSVGLILVIALLVTPAAAARFWTDRMRNMTLVAGMIGAAAAWIGASVSALAPGLPAGAIIVLSCAAAFAVSAVIGPSRGALPRWMEHRRVGRSVRRQHLLRSLHEHAETTGQDGAPAATLARMRAWGPRELTRAIAEGIRAELVRHSSGGIALTRAGRASALQAVRNHRLWEMFLIRYADIAPSHVDRGADAIEHVLGDALIAELEAALAAESIDLPPSPHDLAAESPA